MRKIKSERKLHFGKKIPKELVGGGAYLSSDFYAKIDYREFHQCEKSEGKIVAMSIDMLGISRCGYCGAKVPYGHWIAYKRKIASEKA